MPGEPFELGSVTDIASLCLGVIVLIATGYIAWKQFKLIAEQGKIIDKQLAMMEEQVSISKRIEDISVKQSQIVDRQLAMMGEQVSISKRIEDVSTKQAQIATTQHQIMQEQMNRRASLEMFLLPLEITTDFTRYTLAIRNNGNKTATGIFWHIFVPSDRMDDIAIEFSRLTSPEGARVNDIVYRYFKNYNDNPVFPTRSVTYGTLVHKHPPQNPRSIEMLWKLVAEDGQFPSAQEYGKLVTGGRPAAQQS